MSKARIFISYRRSDSAGWAGRLHADLQRRLGAEQVFRDVAIPPGVDFVEHIERVLDSCDITIAVIGPQWATTPGPDGLPRLQDPADLVRIEIQHALDRPDVQVVPVLVDGARMPAARDLPTELTALSRRNACELTDTRWDYDVKNLCRELLRERRSRRILAIGAAVAATAIGAGAVVLIAGRDDGPRPPVQSALTDDDSNTTTREPPPRITHTPISRVANSIVWARRRVWTTSSQGASLVPLVEDTHKRERRVPLPSYGSSVAARSGSLWVASEKARTVTPIELDTRRAAQPIELPGGRPLVVAADRATGVWVGVRVSSRDRGLVPSVVQIDPATGTVKPYLLNHTVQHLAVGLGAAWVIYRNKALLTRIDANGIKKHITIESSDPQRVAVGAKYVWVTNGQDGTVTRIRPPGRLKWTIRLPGSSPRAIAIGGGRVWVADTKQSSLIQINPANRRIVGSPIAVEDPVAVAAHGRHVWVTTQGGSVVRVDLP